MPLKRKERERERGFRERNRWVGDVVVEGSCIFTGMAAITRPREIQLSGVVETAVARNDISPLPRFRHSLKFIRIRRSVSAGELVGTRVRVHPRGKERTPGNLHGKYPLISSVHEHVCSAPSFRNYLNTSRIHPRIIFLGQSSLKLQVGARKSDRKISFFPRLSLVPRYIGSELCVE